MVDLSFGTTSARISCTGAELKSLKADSVEYIWQGESGVWSGSSPVLFPICGALKDNEYIYGGNTYKLSKHGFAMHKVFDIERKTENSATFLLKADEQTKEVYPFDFEFRVTYTLSEAKLRVDYEIKNLSDYTMYFSVGAHEGYYLADGLLDYEIEFPQNETLYTWLLKDGALSDERKLILNGGKVLPLKYEYFAEDALILKGLKSKSAILTPKQNGKRIKVSFPGFDYFLIWTVPKADFVCLEPWCGITDGIDHNKDIKIKEGINASEPGAVFLRTHTVEII